jgi:diguanylate cyclase (GGDEF)-like protein
MTANKQNGKILKEKFARKETDESLRWSETILRKVFDAIPDHLAVIDRDLRILHSNWRSGYEYVDEEVREQSPICYQAYYPGQERHCEPCHALEVFRTGSPITMEKDNPRIGTVEIRAYPLFDESGQVVMVVEHIRNINDRKKMEEALRKSQDELLAQNRQLTDLFQQVEHQAHHDGLTSLPNRSLLADRINQAILLAPRNNKQVAVIFVDLDNFKFINDSLGHDFGDELLKTAAQRLTGCVRRSDTVARQGGDEFVIVISVTEAEECVAAIAGKIREQITRPITSKGKELSVTCSMGISVFPKDGNDVQTLINHADVAMYRAKEMGGDNFQFFSEEMNARSVARLTMERHLRKALENNEFTLHYQPKVSLRSGLITGMEALLRWKNPELGMVSPARFIPLAEETGLIGPIGEWVLRTACMQNRAWQESGLPPLRVAVNVSVRQFKHTDLTAVIGRVLRETGLYPHYLELEVTENAVIQNMDKMITTLNELKAMGIHLAMDDFGSGFASLYYMKHFSFDKLKLDCSFVSDITSNPDSSAIARAVIAMAHSLNLKVIAEGVETEGQLNYLRDHGCDEMQGYYFSRPVPAAEFAGLLQMGHSLKFAADDASLPEKCILVVDDEENAVSAIERNLTLDGYRVLTAKSAAEGFDLLATNRVAVVIADQWMPEMNGSEFLSRVRKIHPDTVRILITGRGELESVTDAINYGAIFKFLTKPWDDEFLRGAVGEAFRHYESVQRIE